MVLGDSRSAVQSCVVAHFSRIKASLNGQATVAHFSHRHPGETGASTEAPEVALGNDAAKLASLFGISRNRLVGFKVSITLDGKAELAADGRELSERDVL